MKQTRLNKLYTRSFMKQNRVNELYTGYVS